MVEPALFGLLVEDGELPAAADVGEVEGGVDERVTPCIAPVSI
jgi:hypothetical protein